MTTARHIWAIFTVATKRLLAQKGLALATLIGLMIAMTLTISIPLYADAVSYRTLQEELSNPSSKGRSNRPPYAFLMRYLGSNRGTVSWEDARQVDAYLSGPAQESLQLPLGFSVRHFKTDPYRLFAGDETTYADNRTLAWVNIGFITDIENQIDIVEGTFPMPSSDGTSSANDAIEVLVSEPLAFDLGLQANETYVILLSNQAANRRQIRVRISGIWRPIDPQAAFWFYDPKALEELFILSEETYINRIVPLIEQDVYLGLWYWTMDGSAIRGEDALPLLSRIQAMAQDAHTLLPYTDLSLSPVGPLSRYQQAADLLTLLLFAFSIPIFGLTLAFISLVVNLLVERQRNEIAVLRSRGGTKVQLIGVALLESLILGTLALALSFPLSQYLAQLIGQTRSFLNFSLETELSLSLTNVTIRIALLGLGLILAAQILPTLGASQHTIITYKQDQARQVRPPWWQRAWLDLLLLIPAAYGTYLLQQQGRLIILDSDTLNTADPFQNPLLFLVPALSIFALSLVLLRLMPILMAGLAWLLSFTGSVGLLLALRQLARSPGAYTAPLVLLILTLSLSAYTASLAQTLDHHLYDQMYYKIGADMTFIDFESLDVGGLFGEFAGQSADGQGPSWAFFPHQEYLSVAGVETVARVGKYQGALRTGSRSETITFMGIERIDFGQVAYWRPDFAAVDLSHLLNALALAPDGVLVPQDLMTRNALRIGDLLRMQIDLSGERLELGLTIVGSFELFPAWYPEDSVLLVGNLNFLFQQVGGAMPYRIWLNADPTHTFEQITADMTDLNFWVRPDRLPEQRILAEQQRPERQGLFGVLSIGFMGAAILTILGFLLYAFFSFRRRFVELGTLRAVGLSSWDMIVFIFWELIFLVLIGVATGTGLGAMVSYVFIPFLQIGSHVATQIPPFLVEIAWPAVFRMYALFGIFFFIALVGLIISLLRMKIFQALKLGEAV